MYGTFACTGIYVVVLVLYGKTYQRLLEVLYEKGSIGDIVDNQFDLFVSFRMLGQQ